MWHTMMAANKVREKVTSHPRTRPLHHLGQGGDCGAMLAAPFSRDAMASAVG